MLKKETHTIIGSANKPILIDTTYQENSKPKKVVVFSHGFKGFKDWGPFNKIAETFAENDFVFVKFNFSHNGTTIDDAVNFVDLDAFGNNNFCKELDDVGFVLDWVEEYFIDAKIFLFGHSRGGGISILKSGEDSRINKIVSVSPSTPFPNPVP